MKEKFKITNGTGWLLIVLLVMGSCSNEDSTVNEEDSAFEVAQLVSSDEAESISEEIATIGEDVMATEAINATGKSLYRSNYLPDCVTITKVVTDTTRETTIDFGEGCELPNGNLLSGILFLSRSRDADAATATVNFSLENFSFNGVAVEGGGTLVRTASNENGNPQSDAVASYNGVWPDGSTASFEGNRTREWIEGYGSGYWADNVFLITGKGTYNGKLGNVHSREITTPLRRELSCRFIVSGVVEVSRNDASVSLDFGDGSCDAKGELTYPDGSTEEIFLRRFNK
ncbi:hypothetical protein EHW67_11390 [Arenibacter aquaticus]|uniref:Lipoprotein n=1 Tax=Arenibacter aquaticus TaxID=2489054 RepID=A0A3S0IMQ8_9FLAO|nr:hypothetical protein [Arenibacter aquaticus]RTE53598.1 hypothetical protein EHW67_11390 [Arenibacter aquaticus]